MKAFLLDDALKACKYLIASKNKGMETVCVQIEPKFMR